MVSDALRPRQTLCITVILNLVIHYLAKYAETSSLEGTLAPFLTSSQATTLLSERQTSLLLTIIPRISWSTEKKLRAAGQWDELVTQMQKDGGWSELAVVQDADRLDAIGAFGVRSSASHSRFMDL